jgi:hypothetical protein
MQAGVVPRTAAGVTGNCLIREVRQYWLEAELLKSLVIVAWSRCMAQFHVREREGGGSFGGGSDAPLCW